MNKHKSKILYLITKSNFGGAQKYVLELADAAKEKGFEVEVACGGTGKSGADTGLLFDKLSQSGIKATKIKNFQRDMSFLSDIFAFFEVCKLLLVSKPDVLHVTSSKAGGIGALAGRLTNIKNIVFTSHGLTVDETWRPVWQRILIYIGTWLTIKLSHHTIMISSETYERAKKMMGNSAKVCLIKNGISPIDFIGRDQSRKYLTSDIPNNTIWIGGVGELHKNKNWSSAVTAMSTLPKEAHLVIIGEGDERQNLEAQIKTEKLEDRVHLLGFKDAPKHLKAFDIFILPSKKEGLPYVLLEAGSANLPTIASNLPGNQDIITTGQDGFLIEPTPKMLSTTLEMLIRDEGMRRNLGANLAKTISTEFSIEKMFGQTLTLYESNISGA